MFVSWTVSRTYSNIQTVRRATHTFAIKWIIIDVLRYVKIRVYISYLYACISQNLNHRLVKSMGLVPSKGVPTHTS